MTWLDRFRPAPYLFLLPLFFVFHGLASHPGLVPLKDASILLLIYVVASCLVFLLCRWAMKSDRKASLMAFVLMLYFFFFGPFYDALYRVAPNSFISRYSFILPLSLIFFTVIFFWLKRSSSSFRTITRYLNLLFLLLILVDMFSLVMKSGKNKKTEVARYDWKKCDSCASPDIYLIVADGYPGLYQLTDVLQFDNRPFEDSLRHLGFFVADSSRSNYNFTQYAVASMLNMQYVEGIKGINSDAGDIDNCYETIKRASLFDFLKSRDYSILNYSIFDLQNDPSLAKPTFLPRKTSVITGQTLFKRLEKNLAHNLVSKLNMQFLKRWVYQQDLKNNTKFFDKTLAAARAPRSPQFVYSHFVMPHYPYYFDSAGNATPAKYLTEQYSTDENRFRSYLQYANRRYLSFLNELRKKAPQAIIIFTGDHGLREFNRTVPQHYHFMNLAAVYLPGRNYSSFYKAVSNVNLFRIVLNEQFGQQLPLLKDSTSFLRD